MICATELLILIHTNSYNCKIINLVLILNTSYLVYAITLALLFIVESGVIFHDKTYEDKKLQALIVSDEGTYKYKIIPYSDWIDITFAPVKRMRNGMVVVASVVLLIAFIGLSGYLQGEMARRRKEIALRKVCGASTSEVLVVLGARLLWIVLPAVVCGVAIAVWLNEEWLSTLAQMRCNVPVWIYIAGVLAVMAFVYAVQLLLSCRAANENPVEMIKRNN